MRKLVLSYYVSIDGKSTDGNGIREVMSSMDDEEQEAAYVEQLWEAGAFLMGRVSYEAMAGFWPTSEHPSAKAMNEIPKVVFSRSLVTADEWRETRIVDGDIVDEVTKLKAAPGKDLFAIGGDSFQNSLVRSGLVDEYRLWMLPAFAGSGAPLVPQLDGPIRLRLVRSTAYPLGVVELRYAPADS